MLANPFETLLELPEALPAQHERHIIPHGNEGTAATISQMQKLVSQGKRDDFVRNKAGRIINGHEGVPGARDKNYYEYAKSIFLYCRDRIKYAFDPSGVEYVESPRRVIENGIADCDSIVMLFAALCEHLGMPCKYVTIKADRSKPTEFSHVYARVNVPGRGWVAADPTMKEKPFGWEPKGYIEKQWPASKDPPEADMSGLGAVDIFRCNLTGLSESNPGVIEVVGKIYDGSMRNELIDYRTRLDAQVRTVDILWKQVAAMPEGERKRQAYQQVLAARNEHANANLKLGEAISGHNLIASEFRRFGGNVPDVQGRGMAALGWAPIVISVAAIAKVAVIASAIVAAIAYITKALRTNNNYVDAVKQLVAAGMDPQRAAEFVSQVEDARGAGDKGYVTQFADLIESFSTIGLIGLAAATGWVVYGALKKRGKL